MGHAQIWLMKARAHCGLGRDASGQLWSGAGGRLARTPSGQKGAQRKDWEAWKGFKMLHNASKSETSWQIMGQMGQEMSNTHTYIYIRILLHSIMIFKGKFSIPNPWMNRWWLMRRIISVTAFVSIFQNMFHHISIIFYNHLWWQNDTCR